MQVNQFIMICLIVTAMIVVSSNLVEWIKSIITIIFTMIFPIIVSAILLIGSAVIGLFLCVVFVISSLIVYLKKKFGKE